MTKPAAPEEPAIRTLVVDDNRVHRSAMTMTL